MSFDRRRFLKAFLASSGCFAISACAGNVAGLRTGAEEGQPGRFRFPQGVASADPQPDAVLLWTRVESGNGSATDIEVMLEVASNAVFTDVVARQAVRATAESDHTVRVFVDSLQPDTTYYYRFRAGADVTPLVGRTRTAPLPGAARPANIAIASCQNYDMGYFSPYRHMVNQDNLAAAAMQIDFVLHLGDFIYELLNFGQGRNLIVPSPLPGTTGMARVVPPFPSGGLSSKSASSLADTLADYRHLYKTYLSDPDLQAARARFPFVCVWDDHEFVNDARQSYSATGPAQRRRVDATRAWSEYVPAILTGTQGVPGVVTRAHDFVPVQVRDAPMGEVDEENRSTEPNNLAAIGAIRIFRSLRWGRHVDLVLTDNRSYRSQSGLPHELEQHDAVVPMVLEPAPAEAIAVFDAGRTYDGGRPPDSVSFLGKQVPNYRKGSPPGTVLGPEQKAWWKETMERSDATWKLWANTIPASAFRLDLSRLAEGRADTIIWPDSWDGYPVERRELMRHLLDRHITNVIALAGDRHAHFAGLLMDDYDSPVPRPVAPEFTVAGINAVSRIVVFELQTRNFPEIHELVVADGSALGREGPVPILNMTLLDGAQSARIASRTGRLDEARRHANPEQNPHLAYADTHAYGYGIVRVEEKRATYEYVTFAPLLEDKGAAGAEPVRRTKFEVAAWKAGDQPQLVGPEFTGKPPFPFDA